MIKLSTMPLFLIAQGLAITESAQAAHDRRSQFECLKMAARP